jgi:signal transduction histidine kinase
MFGYEKGEITNYFEWYNLIHNEDKKNVSNLFDNIFNKSSDTIICEYRLKTKNEGFKWVFARGKSFLDENNELDRMLMMSMDIDKNKRMKKELLDIELLVEDGKIVIFKLHNDVSLSVKFMSNSIKNYGYLKKDFEDKNINFIDLIHHEDKSKVLVALNAALKKDLLDFTFVCRTLNAANEIRWISCRTILIKNHEGEVIHLYGYLNDITKIKVSEEELKIKIEEELDKNRQKDKILIQQSKMASMGEMLGSIAHQWRQPLNNVSLILQFVQDNYDNKDIKKEQLEKFINKANTHIEYMSDTIDDFRDFYKPSKTKIDFNIKDCCDSLLHMTRSQYENQGIRINYYAKDIVIHNYENELKQALLNILNNASDALLVKMKNTKIDACIEIGIEELNQTAIITISNNGDCIKEDILHRIFEPYFSTKFESQGTGIGLYMTQSIIETNMRGSIKVVNMKKGVSFIITLNIKD